MSDATTATKATQERVWAAAREMEGEGREATSRAIIDRVGGSSETVLRHLRTYNKSKTPPSNVPAVPGALAKRFTGVLEAVWTEAYTIAAPDMEAVRAEATVDVAAEQRAADEATAECGRLEVFIARSTRFTFRGRADAEHLAERLTLRDRQADGRRMCVECRELEASGHCAAVRSGALTTIDGSIEPTPNALMPCPAFSLAFKDTDHHGR